MQAGSFLNRLAEWTVAACFPSECPFCGSMSKRHAIAPFCSSCWSAMETFGSPHLDQNTRQVTCRICSKLLVSEEATVCGDCMISTPRFRRAVCFGPYEDPLKDAIHVMKFRPVKRLGRPLGRLLGGLELPDADIVMPVPSGLRGLRARGFNHCHVMAHEVSRATGARLVSGLLYKKKDTPPQVGLSAIARRLNLRGAFAMRQRLAGEHVILVDDVITTGSTMNECTKTLLKAGASEVTAVALARA